MATKRLATDDGLNRIVEAIKNQDTVKARNAEIDAHAKEVMDSLPSDYTDLVKRVDNVLNNLYTLNWRKYKKVDSNNGNFLSDPVYKATELVEIPEWVDIVSTISENNQGFNAWYNSDKEFISKFDIQSGTSIIIKPKDAKYLALSCPMDTDISLHLFTFTQIIEILKIRARDGIYPVYVKRSETYNVNVGYEGSIAPPGNEGNSRALFDVSGYNNQVVRLCGAEMGTVLQFSDSTSPDTYLGYKFNCNGRNYHELTVADGAKYLAVNVKGDINLLRLKTSESYVTKKELGERVYIKEKTLCTVGDSITQGAGATSGGNNYSYRLYQKLVDEGVVTKLRNLGAGGCTSTAIASYCGAISLCITESVTIPASGSVSIKINHEDIRDPAGSVAHCNPCYLSNIKGNLAYSNEEYTFTRLEEGNPIIVASGTAIITNANRNCMDAEILTIFVGTNDKINTYGNNIETSISNTVRLSELSRNGKYLVIIPYVNSTSDEYRNQMLDTFGSKCIDLYKYFSEQAVYDAIDKGLISDGSQSNWINVITADGVHPNDVGHKLIADLMYERMKILGYLN